MINNLKKELITSLTRISEPRLTPVIKALENTTKPIQKDEKLRKFFELLFQEVPEVQVDSTIIGLCQGLKPNPIKISYQVKKR